MSYNRPRHGRITLYTLSLPCILFAANGFAGNNKTFGASTRAESMGGAFVAIADDASAAYYNPAGLTQLEGFSVLMNVTPILPRSSYTNSLNGIKTTNHKQALSSTTYLSKRVNDKIALGFGVYAPFARAASYLNTPATYDYRFRTQSVEMSFAPVIAVKATEKFSLGFGPIINYDYLTASLLGFKQKATGFSMSGVFSGLYKLNEAIKLGITYHLPSKLNLPGYGNGMYRGTPVPHLKNSMRYANPGYLDAGIAFQATEKLLIGLGAGIEFWTEAKSASFVYPSSYPASNIIQFNPKNSYDARAGIEYTFKQDQSVRLGYAFLQRALPPEGILPGVLDFNINLLSAGYSKLLTKSLRLDLGYEYATSNDEVSKSMIYNPFIGTYHGRVNTIMLGINYQT